MSLLKFQSKLLVILVFLLLFQAALFFGSGDVAQDLLPYLTDHCLDLIHFYFVMYFLGNSVNIPVVGFGLDGREQLLSETFQLLILVLIKSHYLLL
jgi:hypothetical protein